MKQPPLLFVKWLDHNAVASWEDINVFHGPSIIYSTGWLEKEDKKGISISAARHPDGLKTVSNLQYIIKSCIVERKILHCPKM